MLAHGHHEIYTSFLLKAASCDIDNGEGAWTDKTGRPASLVLFCSNAGATRHENVIIIDTFNIIFWRLTDKGMFDDQ